MTELLLDSDEIRRSLDTRLLGRSVYCFDSTTSTQDEARALALRDAPEGTLVLAEEQTAGRGRLNHTWRSPKGLNLYCSLILHPPPWVLRRLTMVSSLAVARTVRAVTGLAPTAKWPNDVRLNGRKLAGVLVEAEMVGPVAQYAILGIGLNVNLDPAAYPDIADIATSLAKETGHPWERLPVLATLLKELELLYVELQEGRAPLPEWRALLDTLGQYVQVRSGDDVYAGFARDVDDEGNLLLTLPDASITTLVAGEVTLQVKG